MRWWLWATLIGCGGPGQDAVPIDDTGYDWGLPPGVEPPPVPADNPMNRHKVALGRALFFDFRLSVDEARACGICHEPAKGFTDGFPRAVGALGDLHRHNTLSLTNVGYRQPLTWARTDLHTLESQLLVPLFGEDPIEMGRTPGELEALIESDPDYAAQFPQAFPTDAAPYTVDHIGWALAAFERTLISRNSPWDRYLRGDLSALSASEARGMDLFFGDRLGCGACHGGPDLDQPTDASGQPAGPPGYHNIGLYDVDGQGAYPDGGEGLMSETGLVADMGRFRTPTLRNLAWTAPYFHDGTGASLEDAVDVFARGGRLTPDGPNPGDGRLSPLKDPSLTGFDWTPQERSDLLAFLHALGDPEFIADPRWSDPAVE